MRRAVILLVVYGLVGIAAACFSAFGVLVLATRVIRDSETET